jgi:hypothetical protein
VADTFLTLIPGLPDAKLLEYCRNPMAYKTEAVEAALAELQKRGLGLPDAELDTLRQQLQQREAAKHAAATAPGLLRDEHGPRMGRIRWITGAILAAGLGSAAVIYAVAVSAAPSDFDLDLTESKKYLRDVESIGGKSNLIASQIRLWFDGLWHGTSLAWTVLCLAVLLAAAFWFVTTRNHAERPQA